MTKPGVRAGENINAPILEVNHADLEEALPGSDSYRRDCPKCGGVLPVQRDPRSFALLALDRCCVCGQAVKYLDIEKLRTGE